MEELADMGEWHDRSLQLIAGVPGSEHILDGFLAVDPNQLDKDIAVHQTAERLLGLAVELAEGLRGEDLSNYYDSWLEGEQAPACPSLHELLTPNSTSAVAEALQLIHFSPASPEKKEEMKKLIQTLKTELEGPDLRWEALQPLIVRLAESGEGLFFTVMPWLLERRRALG